MHDLLQEMGRYIVYEESSSNPGKRSRLWSRDDIDRVLINDMGSDAIQCIALSSDYEAYWSPEAFLKTIQLKFLSLSAIKLPHGLNYLPRSLKVLHWNRCPLETLPLVDQSYEVVEMKLNRSNIKQLWYGKKILTMLNYLDLSDSGQLKETPDLSAVPILKTLILKYCTSLIEIHPSLVQHKKLVLLDLSYCNRLETLPGKLEMSSLEELILSGCIGLTDLPEFGECMKHLSALRLCGCESLVSLPDSINQLKSLRILDAGGCQKLRRLPYSVSSLSLLSILDLSFCNLSSFPHDFCHLSSLTDLDLIGNPLGSLPISFHELAKLRCLSISACPNIRYLLEFPSSIRELQAEDCDSLHMSQLLDLSESCNISTSTRYNHGQVIIKLIPSSEIPSDYTINQEDGNCISLPRPDNCLLNKGLGIDLCFLFETLKSCHDVPELSLALCWNGKRFLARKMSPEMGPGRYRYFFITKSDYLNSWFHEGDRFELSIEEGPPDCVEILGSAARWFCSDIEY